MTSCIWLFYRPVCTIPTSRFYVLWALCWLLFFEGHIEVANILVFLIFITGLVRDIFYEVENSSPLRLLCLRKKIKFKFLRTMQWLEEGRRRQKYPRIKLRDAKYECLGNIVLRYYYLKKCYLDVDLFRFTIISVVLVQQQLFLKCMSSSIHKAHSWGILFLGIQNILHRKIYKLNNIIIRANLDETLSLNIPIITED